MSDEGQTQSVSELPVSQPTGEQTVPSDQSQSSDSELPPLTITTNPVLIQHSYTPPKSENNTSETQEEE